MTGFDLHSHTTLSDGTTTPEDNVALAVAMGLSGLGVTDHDTTAPFGRAVAAAEGTGLELVLGTEFSAEHGRWSVHVLGYWIDADDLDLIEELDRLRNEREHRARAMVQRFNALGVPVRLDRVRQLAGGAPIGRPHVAQAVVDVGGAPDTQAVFDEWLADGGPAYVEKHAVTPVRAVQLLRAAGGVAVLAHPGLWGARDGSGGIAEDVIEEMSAAGMAGIEADHPDHTEEQRRRYRDVASGLGLQVTAGSDYHGAAKPNRLGQATTDRGVVEALREQRRSSPPR